MAQGASEPVRMSSSILCGASLVQVGTALHQEGVGIFDRLVAELEVIMEAKGYTCLDDFRGKLREIE